VSTFRTDNGLGFGATAPSVAVADLNGDGKPELVTAWNDGDITGNNVSVLRGNGNGSFQSPQIYGGFGGVDNSPEAVVANLNGKPDIVFTNSYNVGVMLNNGDGTFANPVYYRGGFGFDSDESSNEHPRIALADLGNGNLDIVTIDTPAGSPGAVVVDLGNGDGTFQPPTSFTTGSDRTAPFTVADLGNGTHDIVTGNVDGTVSVLPCQVDANNNVTFGAPTILLVGSTTAPGTRFSFTSVAVADLNGDGKADIVAANNSDNTVSVLLGNGNGTFKAQTTYAVGSFPGPVAVGDVDGNGTLDIVTANFGDSSVSVLPGDGHGNFGSQQSLSMVARPESIAVANLGNGTDIITGNASGGNFVSTVTVLSNSNNGNFLGQVCTISTTPPVVHIAALSPVAANTVNLELSVTDASSYEASFGFSAYTIEWGDGTQTVSPTAASASGYAVTHTYARGGNYGIAAYVTAAADGDRGFSTVGAVLSQYPYENITVSAHDINPGVGQEGVDVTGNGFPPGFDRPNLIYVTSQVQDYFSVNFGSVLTAPIAIFGSGSDTLTVNGDSSLFNYITKTPGQITWGSPVTETVSYSGISHTIINTNGVGQNVIHDPGGDTVINGGPGDNTIIITATTGNGVVINGGPTTNTYVVDLGSLAGPVSIANSNTSASNSLVVNGAAGDNTISAAGSQVTEGAQTITDTAALTNLAIVGGSGNNQITVSTLTVPVQGLTLDGSAGSANTITVSQSVTAPTTLTGGSGTNTLTGGGGTTTFIDNGGANTIVAGTGVNVLIPGGGTDSFQVPPGATTPIVFADSYTVLANGVLNVAAGGVLVNDLSPDGNPLTAVLVSSTAHGTLALNSNGSFRYTPAANFGGTDTFTYQARSSTGTLSSVATATIHVAYTFSGFLAPLTSNLAFGLGRTVPIKFQITGANGASISSLSAVTSLMVFNSSGTDVLAGAGKTGLRYDATTNQFVYNWQTKGLSAGSYTVVLTLADGTTHSQTVQVAASSGSAKLVTDASDASGSALSGALLGGDLEIYVDNASGDLTADELASIADAVASADALTEPYGVSVTLVSDPTQADITLDFKDSSAVGGYADGVLGCTTDAGEITLIQGWNWYAGADTTQIGADQFDFETVVEHELGHALGLGHSTDGASVMYATLATGAVRRALTAADLNVPDTDSGACGLHAEVLPAVTSGSNDALMDSRDVSPGSRGGPWMLPEAGVSPTPLSGTDNNGLMVWPFDGNEVALCALMDEWTSNHDLTLPKANRTDRGSALLSQLDGDSFLLDKGRSQTVFNSSSSGMRTDSAGSAWFFAGTADKSTDLNAIDQAFIFGL
jgi:hypothetical protein